MKVALVRPPLTLGPATYSLLVVPPLGLAYLKAVARPLASEVVVVDSWANHPEVRPLAGNKYGFNLFGQTAEEIAASVPADTDVVLVTVLFSTDWPYAREVFASLRRRCPKALIVAGGEHVSALPEFCLREAPEIDLCGMGEGEAVVQELLEAVRDGRPTTGLSGTCERLEGGTFRRNPRRARIKEVGSIPWPDWEGFPLDVYFSRGFGYGVDLGRSLPILATRGCPYQCTFCSSPQMWTTTWKAREPADVVDEISALNARYGVTNFDFYDLTAILRKDWIRDFCELVVARGLKITFQLPVGTRSEAIDRDVARLLFKAGCRNITYAPESGSERVLKLIKKKIKLERMIESMEGCIAEGLSVKLNMICGFPGETRDDLRETLKFLVKCALIGVDDMSMAQMTPYPGSAIFDGLVESGRLKLDDDYFASLVGYNSITSTTSYVDGLTSAELNAFKWLSISTFYGAVYARRPRKFARLVRNVLVGEETTRIEKAFRTVLDRTVRKGRPPPTRDAPPPAPAPAPPPPLVQLGAEKPRARAS